MRRGGLLGLLPVAAAALLLAGCSTAADPGAAAPEETPAPELTAVPLTPLTHPDVLAYCPDLPAGHLAVAAAEVVEVFRCTTEFGLDGAPTIEYVDRVVEDRDALLEAYDTADTGRPADQMCTLDMADPLILWLELATGDTVAVRAPTDECGKPQLAVQAVLVGTTFETVLEQPLG